MLLAVACNVGVHQIGIEEVGFGKETLQLLLAKRFPIKREKKFRMPFSKLQGALNVPVSMH